MSFIVELRQLDLFYLIVCRIHCQVVCSIRKYQSGTIFILYVGLVSNCMCWGIIKSCMLRVISFCFVRIYSMHWNKCQQI